MKRVFKHSTSAQSKFVFFGTPNQPGSPDFSSDDGGPLPASLIKEGAKHEQILSDTNRNRITQICKIPNVLALTKQLNDNTFTIEAPRIIERLISAVITPGKQASIAIPDIDKLTDALEKNPEDIIKEVVESVREATGMCDHFIGRSVAYHMSQNL